MSANIPIFFLQCRAISQVRHSEDNRVDTENRTVYIVIVVDYSTAFDTMDRGRLLIAADGHAVTGADRRHYRTCG